MCQSGFEGPPYLRSGKVENWVTIFVCRRCNPARKGHRAIEGEIRKMTT